MTDSKDKEGKNTQKDKNTKREACEYSWMCYDIHQQLLLDNESKQLTTDGILE